MTISPNILHQHERDAARPRRGRLYVFAVVATATFLVGIAFWRSPVVGYTARTTISRQPPLRTVGAADQANNPRPGQEDTLAVQEIGSAQFLLQAVSQSDLAELSAGPAGEALSDDQILDSIHDRLQVTSEAGTGAGETHIKITYQHASEDLAVKLVDLLARQYLALHKQNPPKDDPIQHIARAEQEVADAHQQVESAKQRLNNFLKEHFEDPQRGQNAPPVQQSPPPRRIALNPAWVQLSGQLSRLKAKLTQLLVERTEAHPEVRDVQWQIGQLQQLLEATPRMIGQPESPRQPAATQRGTDLEHRPPEVANAPAPDARLRKPPELGANRQLYQRLIGQYEQAQQRFELAEQDLRWARQQGWSFSAAHYVIIEPARIVQHHGGVPTQKSVWILGLAATLAGGIVSLTARASSGSGTINSVAQAQSLLRLPIMGAISTTDGPIIPRAGKARLYLARSATLLCELILLAAVLIMVVWLMSGRSHSSQFTQNPFGTFSVAVQDIASWWF